MGSLALSNELWQAVRFWRTMAGWGCLHRQGARGRGLLPARRHAGRRRLPALPKGTGAKRGHAGTRAAAGGLGQRDRRPPAGPSLPRWVPRGRAARRWDSWDAEPRPEVELRCPSFFQASIFFTPCVLSLTPWVYCSLSLWLCCIPWSFLTLQQNFQND